MKGVLRIREMISYLDLRHMIRWESSRVFGFQRGWPATEHARRYWLRHYRPRVLVRRLTENDD